MSFLRRLAAVVALAAPVYAIAAGVEYLFTQPDDLVVLVVVVALLTVAAWYALTRRGLVRLIAVLVAVLTLPLVLLIGLAVFLTQIVLLVIFAVSGRYALGPHAGTLFEKAPPAGPARHGVLFINPRSGDGKAARLHLDAEADRRGIRPVVLAPGDDLLELAEQAVADGADVIGMAGGDGSQALVASVAMRRGVAFVCVPSGTRNHFALDLGLDRGTSSRRLMLTTIGGTDHRPGAGQRPGVREQRLARRVCPGGAVRGVPECEGADLGTTAAGPDRPGGAAPGPGVRRTG